MGLFFLTRFLTCFFGVSFHPLCPRNSQILVLGFLQLGSQATSTPQRDTKYRRCPYFGKSPEKHSCHAPSPHLDTRKTLTAHLWRGRLHLVTAGGQLEKVVESGAGGCLVYACAEARNGTSLRGSAAVLPRRRPALPPTGNRLVVPWGGQRQRGRLGGQRGAGRWQREKRLCGGRGGRSVRVARAETGPGGRGSGTPLVATPRVHGIIRVVPAGVGVVQ